MRILVLAFAVASAAAFAVTVDRNEMGQCGYTGADDFWDASARAPAAVEVAEGSAGDVVVLTERDFYSEGIDLDTCAPGGCLVVR